MLDAPGGAAAPDVLPARKRLRGTPENVAGQITRRRAIVVLLNATTIALLIATMSYLLSLGGWTSIEMAMLAAYAITLPWLSIGFWNAIIGFLVLRFSPDPLHTISPMLAGDHRADAIIARTAVAMAIRNEDPDASITRLKAIYRDLDRAGMLAHFDFHLLSDTDDPAIGAREEQLVATWRREAGPRGRIFYRRRTDNTGYKAGNLDEFCNRTADDYDYFLPLDADSFMSAQAIVDFVRIMQRNPNLGILQGLVVGSPSRSFFTRTFQFGMRHGMRAYTTGSAWWQADCGPYWGHNALIRMKPFRDHCKLPLIRGRGPLSGYILSHDQVEAVLMRRAGYDVRVFAMEGESWEENPPALPDFIRRELRWCQGNMQYWSLLGMPGLKPTSRVQLALAILMYLGAPAWMAFISLGAVQSLTATTFVAFPVVIGASLFFFILSMSLMPKLMGLLVTLARKSERERYGGTWRVISGGLHEIVFASLIAPVVGFAITVFVAGLAFGRKLVWRVQQRDVHAVTWGEALVSFWPQTLFGSALAVTLWHTAPQVLPWAAPVLAGFLLSIPVAVLTSSRALGRFSVRSGLCDIPEDRNPPAPLMRLLADTNRDDEPSGEDISTIGRPGRPSRQAS